MVAICSLVCALISKCFNAPLPFRQLAGVKGGIVEVVGNSENFKRREIAEVRKKYPRDILRPFLIKTLYENLRAQRRPGRG